MPGPGAYHNDKQSLIKLSKANSYGNFGSLSKRFSATAGLFGNPIGPGEYNPMLGGLIGKNPHVRRSFKCELILKRICRRLR